METTLTFKRVYNDSWIVSDKLKFYYIPVNFSEIGNAIEDKSVTLTYNDILKNKKLFDEEWYKTILYHPNWDINYIILKVV